MKLWALCTCVCALGPCHACVRGPRPACRSPPTPSAPQCTLLGARLSFLVAPPKLREQPASTRAPRTRGPACRVGAPSSTATTHPCAGRGTALGAAASLRETSPCVTHEAGWTSTPPGHGLETPASACHSHAREPPMGTAHEGAARGEPPTGEPPTGNCPRGQGRPVSLSPQGPHVCQVPACSPHFPIFCTCTCDMMFSGPGRLFHTLQM